MHLLHLLIGDFSASRVHIWPKGALLLDGTLILSLERLHLCRSLPYVPLELVIVAVRLVHGGPLCRRAEILLCPLDPRRVTKPLLLLELK